MNRNEIKDIEKMEEAYRTYLETLSLSTLRVLSRMRGASRSGSVNKGDLVEALVAVLTGRTEPLQPSRRGAPAKLNFVDPAVLRKLDEIKESFENPTGAVTMRVADCIPQVNQYGEPVVTGILEITQGGYGFLRAKNCQPSATGDVFIPAPMIHSLRLRAGDFVACTAHPRVKNDSPAMDSLYSVNGLPVGKYEQRPLFDSLTACYANRKLALSEGSDAVSLRILDLAVPIGRGQRALIVAPPKAGKTTLLKEIARAIDAKYPEITLIILLIDERPEEVTDIRTSVEGAQVVYSTFDEEAEHHVRAAELTIAHAKRQAELGRDVVILLDSLTKLTRAYNYLTQNSGKTLSGGLDAGAFAEPKRFFGAARATREAGSITILATALVETGSRMDDIIYEEFKGTGNADIFLSRDLAERRIYPAIDIRRSGTRREEFLLSKEELAAIYKLRERRIVENPTGFLEMLKKTSSNAEFIAKLPEWLRIYKS